MAASGLCNLFTCQGGVPECRKPRGKRHPLRTVLAIAVAARLAGYRGVTAFAQFAAMDDKDICGASKQTEDGRRMMVAVAEHRTGMVLGQVEVDAKSNEIPAVRALSCSIDVTGRIVTLDAMHSKRETAHCLIGRHADYAVTAVKENQEIILNDLNAIDFEDATSFETFENGHGRIERRHRAAVDLSRLTTAAIAIVRCGGCFIYMSEANRHYAARPQDVLDAILVPPGGCIVAPDPARCAGNALPDDATVQPCPNTPKSMLGQPDAPATASEADT